MYMYLYTHKCSSYLLEVDATLGVVVAVALAPPAMDGVEEEAVAQAEVNIFTYICIYMNMSDLITQEALKGPDSQM